jgi:hypothetical protein
VGGRIPRTRHKIRRHGFQWVTQYLCHEYGPTLLPLAVLPQPLDVGQLERLDKFILHHRTIPLLRVGQKEMCAVFSPLL